ncbi:hypothetical protein [Latilactobacillus curvatus]|nr:hypothetical protein [Latilactobacillus curvatus]
MKQDWKSLLILLVVAIVIGLAECGIRMKRESIKREDDPFIAR